MTGIDISGVQPPTIPGTWEFVVVKLTEGGQVVNPDAGEQWVFAHTAPRRGFYHYARPAISDGATQARVFAVQALARGFRPGLDMWQLDAEGMLNTTVDAAAWRTFIDAFMLTAISLLGTAGFLYIGWPFYRQQYGNDLRALQRWPWWDPDYGRNDGARHPISPGAPANLVVIHQFTSAGGLDRNAIADGARFASLFHTPAPPTPAPPAPHPEVVHPMHNPPLVLPPIAADCDAPGGGAWQLGIDGGVFTVGSAQFHGSPAGNKIPLAPGERWAGIRLPKNVGVKGGDAVVPGGNHYTCVKNNGAKFAY